MEEEQLSAGDEESLVLVVVMNNPRDWDILQREHWYRVPVKRAPRQLGADYLAFYHTAAFDEEKWSVRYYAPVRTVHVVRRHTLLPHEANHPRAGEWYYRFDLGSLVALERPLLSRRLRRITFIHTTMKRLLEVDDVADLWLSEPLRERLWVEFNRQGIHAERHAVLQEGPLTRSFDFVIPCYEGYVAVDCPAPASDATISASSREAAPSYPPSETERALEHLRCSWLRFEEAGWPARLDACLEHVWREIARRGGQL